MDMGVFDHQWSSVDSGFGIRGNLSLHIFWLTFFVEYIARDSHFLNTLTTLQFYTPKAYLV